MEDRYPLHHRWVCDLLVFVSLTICAALPRVGWCCGPVVWTAMQQDGYHRDQTVMDKVQWIVDCAYTLRNDYYIHGGLASIMACNLYGREDITAGILRQQIKHPATAAHDHMTGKNDA